MKVEPKIQIYTLEVTRDELEVIFALSWLAETKQTGAATYEGRLHNFIPEDVQLSAAERFNLQFVDKALNLSKKSSS